MGLIPGIGLTAKSQSGSPAELKYQLHVGYGDYAKISSNGGLGWSNTFYNWVTYRKPAINSTGQYMILSLWGTSFATSSNFGVTWTFQSISTSNGFAAAISSTGQYQVVCSTNSIISLSTDYGATWTEKKIYVTNLTTSGVSVSSNGQYMVVVSNWGAFVSSDYGSNWTLVSSGLGSKCAISSSGQYIVTGFTTATYMRVSTNYGVSFNSVGDTAIINDVDCSSSGMYQLASGSGYMRVSSNYGTSWTNIYYPGVSFIGVALSSSGKYQKAVGANNFIYESNDFGLTWNVTSIPSLSNPYLAMQKFAT
ncbi:MAG TPA: hypothetical protein DHV48_10565 [Prolixibacteraceae bacterium]|nr:hypothetical protein [Prolixibacteraceae bacterium]